MPSHAAASVALTVCARAGRSPVKCYLYDDVIGGPSNHRNYCDDSYYSKQSQCTGYSGTQGGYWERN